MVRSGVWPFSSALMFGVLSRDGSRTNRMGPAAVVVRGKKEQKQFCLAADGTGAQTLLPDWRREVRRRSLTLLRETGEETSSGKEPGLKTTKEGLECRRVCLCVV